MGTYSVSFYGWDITERYSEISETFEQHLHDAGITEGPGFYVWDGTPRFSFGSYLEKLDIGESMYDGGGYGQITFIGVKVRKGPNGIVVTDEIRAKVEAIRTRLPSELKDVLQKAANLSIEVAAPTFETAEGWG